MTQDAPLALGCTPTTSSHLHFPAQPCDGPCQRHFSTACTFFVQNLLPTSVLRISTQNVQCQDHPGEFCHLLQLHTKLTLPATLSGIATLKLHFYLRQMGIMSCRRTDPSEQLQVLPGCAFPVSVSEQCVGHRSLCYSPRHIMSSSCDSQLRSLP